MLLLKSFKSILKTATLFLCWGFYSLANAGSPQVQSKPGEVFACEAIEQFDSGSWWQGQADIMGTEVRVELWHAHRAEACEAIAAVMTEMQRIDAEMSPYKESSRLSKLNANAADGFVEVGEELFGLISRSQGYSQLTGGAFDITYASAGRYYDYRKGKKPTSEELAKSINAINFRHLELNPRNYSIRFLNPHVYVDLGGIAKGHAVDSGTRILRERGIDQAMISAGGDSQIIGDRGGEPWVVGVKHPRIESTEVAVLPLFDASISTSGDYERFFIEDGVRYHHIIDPSSGKSAYKVRSVTIIGAESTATDALSTSVFVMGAKRGIDLINRLIGIDAIVVDGEGRMHVSTGLLALDPEQDASGLAGVNYE